MMKHSRKPLAAAIALALAAPAAMAGTFNTDSGLEVQWSLNASYGKSFRAKNADLNLIAVPNGGKAGNGNDDGNKNFAKGDAFSSVLKTTGELQVKGENLGVFVRAFAWTDYTLNNKGMAHGHYSNGYVPGAQLSDAGMDKLSTFQGAALGDAYVFGNVDLDGKPLSFKLGNQVVNWGESLFIPGVNAMGAFDLNAARRPGAQVKEILRPQPQLTANIGLGKGLSLEAFAGIQWRQSVLDGCGTYWSMADSLNCNGGTVLFGDAVGGDAVQFNGAPLLGKLPAALDPLLTSLGLSRSMPLNFKLQQAGKIMPKKGGQWGVSGHYFADAISTDFGFYYANYTTHTPIISLVKTPSDMPSVWSGAVEKLAKAQPALAPALGLLSKVPGGRIAWDYGAENIKTAGVSASTEIGGFSVFGEISRTRDIPVQINAPDMLAGVVAGIGPMASFGTDFRNPAIPNGKVITGYHRKDKTQLQASFIKIVPQILGADSLTLLGEVAGQSWSGIGNPNTSTRYGRGFVYNFGPTTALGGTCAGLNPNAAYCENEGYATSRAWGYRLQAEAQFPNVFAGVNLKPRVFFAHDVSGYSADSYFVKDRQTRSVGLRADYLSRYYADISYTAYNKNAKYDIMHDRDNYSFVVGVNF